MRYAVINNIGNVQHRLCESPCRLATHHFFYSISSIGAFNGLLGEIAIELIGKEGNSLVEEFQNYISTNVI